MTAASYQHFPDGFFDRVDRSDDADFYRSDRMVTHIDEAATAAVTTLYDELEVMGDVLDLMSSWVSHFRKAPRSLTVLGMNAAELEANPQASSTVIHDLNLEPSLPFEDGSFDDVVCCVSVDYLIRPLEVFADVARVLRPGGRFICTFSNRCFPTKAIQGWLMLGDQQRMDLVSLYFEHAGGFEAAEVEVRLPPGATDPLMAVWAVRSRQDSEGEPYAQDG